MIVHFLRPTKSLSIAWATILGGVSVLLTAFFCTRGGFVTDGVMDLHFLSLSSAVAQDGSRFFNNLAQGMINVLWATALLWVAALVMKTRISVFALSAYLMHARWPMAVAAGYLLIPGIGDQILALTFELLAAMPTGPDQVMASPRYLLPAMKLTALSTPLLLTIVWLIWLMYEAYQGLTQLAHRRAIPSFALALLVAEGLSKLTVF